MGAGSVLARVEPSLPIGVLVGGFRLHTSAVIPSLVRACEGFPRKPQA